MRSYDALIILHPHTPEEKRESLIKRFEKKITDAGGAIEKVDIWGMRRFASAFKTVKNIKEGFYILMVFKGEKDTANVLRDTLKVQEEVMRFQITKIEVKAAPEPEEVNFPAVTPEEKTVGQP